MNQTAVIIVNTGTPDSPAVRDVRKYLREFLGDKRVINMPWLFRKLLVNGIIAPIRGPKSAKLYEAIWTREGSPLLVNSRNFGKALQAELGSNYKVLLAMRYGNPSMEEAVKQAAHNDIDRIILFPVYPQYADSTTGSIVAEFGRLIAEFNITKPTGTIEPFFRDKGFIYSFTDKLLANNPEEYDHVLFSFHGLPVKQTEKMHPGMTCAEANCKTEYTPKNERCYYASCYETARLISQEASLPEDRYTVSFQSRLGMNWLKPYTDEVLKELVLKGAKKVLILSPAFVADCLETIHELGVEYKHLFTESGGAQLDLIESLNDDPTWVKAAAKLVQNSLFNETKRV